MAKNTFCPFINSECRYDCKFYDDNLSNCLLDFYMSSVSDDLDFIKSTLYDISRAVNND